DIGADKIFVIDITSGRLLGSTSFKPGSTPSKLRFNGSELFGMDFGQQKAFRLTPALALSANKPVQGVTDQLTAPFVQRQELDLKGQVGNVSDFDVSNNVLYVVDYEKRVLFLFSIEGTAPTSLKYSDYAQAPSAIAVDDKHIYLADPITGSFVEIPLVVP